MSKKNILKRELLNYIGEFPEEARNALAPRVEATLRNALAKARTGMIINRGSNNLRIKGLPKITGSHILEIKAHNDLQLDGFRIARIETYPTFSAGVIFHLSLPFRIEIDDTTYKPILQVTEALGLDLSFSDEINEIYFDYLSDDKLKKEEML
tara:strand:+ start:255 stop:713 length:459 start_codon:yes stop_codon:yes gene_type:complete